MTSFCASRRTGSGDIAYLGGQDKSLINFYTVPSRLPKLRFSETKKPKEKTLRFIFLIPVRFISEIGDCLYFRFDKTGKSRFFLEIFGIFWFFLHIMIECRVRRRLMQLLLKSATDNSTYNLKGFWNVLEFSKNSGRK